MVSNLARFLGLGPALESPTLPVIPIRNFGGKEEKHKISRDFHTLGRGYKKDKFIQI